MPIDAIILRMAKEEDQDEAIVSSEDISNFSLINQGQYLYLRSSSEPSDNSLRVVVEEATSGPRAALPGDGSMSQYRPIESPETCRMFELYWKHYVAYLVTEECVGSCGKYDDEVYTGKLLRYYTRSHFLDHLARDTGGHFKAMRHYKLICLNHLIDIASEDTPEIGVIGS
jgi:hypothetical protein